MTAPFPVRRTRSSPIVFASLASARPARRFAIKSFCTAERRPRIFGFSIRINKPSKALSCPIVICWAEIWCTVLGVAAISNWRARSLRWEEGRLVHLAHGCDFLILALGLAGSTGLALAEYLIEEGHKSGAKVIVIGVQPFAFEGWGRGGRNRARHRADAPRSGPQFWFSPTIG